MSEFLSSAILKLAGIKLNEDNDKFVFDDMNESPSDLIPCVDKSSNAEAKYKKKRTKKKIKTQMYESNGLKSEERKMVRFGSVMVIYFNRSFGYDGIPLKGVYPLGLGTEVGKELFDIDSHEQIHLHEVETRLENLKRNKIAQESTITTGATQTLGNRYRSSSFEEERSILKSIDHSSKHFFELSEIQRRNIFENNNIVDSVTEASAVELCKDIRSIQQSRNNSPGCSCKHLKVDKLSMTKMKAELAQSSSFTTEEINTFSKTQLTSKLKEALQSCVICVSNNCECFQNDIPCSADICSCKGKQRSSQVCDNPNGVYLFDTQHVMEYRKKVLDPLT